MPVHCIVLSCVTSTAQIMPKAELPLLTSVMMITQALLSAPMGIRAKASVKSRNAILLLGCVALVGANASFALLNTTSGAFLCLDSHPDNIACSGMLLGSLLVGIHMAMTHGLTLGMVSAYIPNTKVPGLGRVNGTAWSFTDFVFGIILAYSNSLAGKLADITATKGMGNIGCFFGGGCATVLSMVALALFARYACGCCSILSSLVCTMCSCQVWRPRARGPCADAQSQVVCCCLTPTFVIAQMHAL